MTDLYKRDLTAYSSDARIVTMILLAHLEYDIESLPPNLIYIALSVKMVYMWSTYVVEKTAPIGFAK